jgi:hypothetical protein
MGIESAAKAQRNEGYKNVISCKTKKKPLRVVTGYVTYFEVK